MTGGNGVHRARRRAASVARRPIRLHAKRFRASQRIASRCRPASRPPRRRPAGHRCRVRPAAARSRRRTRARRHRRPGPDTSARPSSKLNQKRPPSPRESGLGADRRVQLSDPRPHVDASRRPARTAATRRCCGPAHASPTATARRRRSPRPTAVTSVIPRNCTLPRAVSSSVPEPNPLATLAPAPPAERR